jgi:hypothetical protein
MSDNQQDPTAEGAPPISEAPADGAESAAGNKAREWLAQLEAMIQSMATQAAPVARQVGAKAAELAAVAAVKAGPAAQRAAELTTDYGQRFADKAHAVAAELRAGPPSTEGGAAADEAAAEGAATTEGGDPPVASA